MSANESVLIVLPRWVRDGGVSAHIGASAQALAAHGMRVTILAARIESDSVPAGVSLLHGPHLFDRSAPIDERLGEALECSPTVVHLNQLGHPELLRALREHAPVVVSAHGYLACTSGVHYFRPGEECMRAHGPGCVPNLLRCAHVRDPRRLPQAYRVAGIERAAMLEADLAISYSSAVDRHLAINGVSRRVVVPYFPTIAPVARTAAPDARRVVFAGRVVAAKGVFTLVRAARELDAEFIVCGDGRELGAMRRLARRLDVDRRMTFAGWLEPQELAHEFANASIVAVPSLWPEPFGIVGIEGFIAGRPAVASATGGVEDWLEDGVSGLTVPAGDVGALAGALSELLDDPARAAEMGAAGKATVEASFSLEHHLSAILDAYASARENWLARGARSAPRQALTPAA